MKLILLPRVVVLAEATKVTIKSINYSAGKNEDRFSFLVDIKDAQRRSPDHPDYDPQTLHIPNSEYIRLTPFERQYWDIKRKFFDTVIFFKKGKFYELYETDADIGHKHLDLKMTDRVNMRMVGVPEANFAHWASKILQLGYKVAKVDELESGLGKEMRQAKEGTKKATELIIRRELSCVMTAGTLTDGTLIPSHSPHYLLVVQESFDKFGFILLDAAAGIFHLGMFEDDGRSTAFETLLLQASPKEIIYPKGISTNALTLIRRMVTLYKIQTHAFPNDYFSSASDTLREMAVNGYSEEDGAIPESLKTALEDLGGADAATLPLEALGACTLYLRSLKQDETILRGAEFKAYSVSPTDHLILDGTSLQNLEVLANTTDGGPRGSLLALLDQCSTAFGKRLFRSWLIRPLCQAAAINERLDAVEDLMNAPGLIDAITAFLSRLPDLERSAARIRSQACKLSEFLNCLRGFEAAWDGFVANLSEDTRASFHSPLLKRACTMPDMEPCLEAMHSYFDWDDARETASITPQRGLDPRLDEALDTVQGYIDQLNAHLKEVKTAMRCVVEFKDIGKERFQIEIPVEAVNKKKDVVKGFTMMSQTKAVKRFHTPLITKLLKPLAEAEYTAEMLKKQALVELQNKFNEHTEKWEQALQCIATLDALVSLAKFSSRAGTTMSRPVFAEKGGNIIALKQSIHPCVVPLSGNDVIPNDIKLGEDSPAVMVLTGPNMGGKSTLLRQTCITVIMAQLGCYVPAASCTLTPVDRIFTRLGARDDIVSGQSTFMVELQETGNMLKNATSSSLVILDELGRGTSTFDGYAIAYSVLAHLASVTRCRTMFSTHYHSLTEEVGRLPSVGLYHMDSIVDEVKKEVAFLYRLTRGQCPRSYGLHVANMALIPNSILEEAQNIADTLHAAILRKVTTRVCQLINATGNDKPDPETFSRLMGLWRAAKGRWISWADTQ